MIDSWANLPNTKYINLILSLLHDTDIIWTLGWTNELNFANDTARNIIKNNGRGLIWDDLFEEVRAICHKSSYRMISRRSIAGLLAYDNYGYLLDSDTNEVEMLAKLGLSAALLLLPACKAIDQMKDII